MQSRLLENCNRVGHIALEMVIMATHQKENDLNSVGADGRRLSVGNIFRIYIAAHHATYNLTAL